MREIKVRGKRVDNGEWVFGFYVYMGVSRRGTSHLEFAHMILDSSSKDAEGLVQYEVIPETVGQYTGLRDRNGVEIYEGDIITMPHLGGIDIGPVEWYGAEWVYRKPNGLWGFSNAYGVEVIGNIHEQEEDTDEPEN